MFTIKCYTDAGRSVIMAAESFTILRTHDSGEAEITLHRKDPSDSLRVDIGAPDAERDIHWPPLFQWAYIENVAGKTVERLHLKPAYYDTMKAPPPHSTKAA